MIPCRPCLYSDSVALSVFGWNHLHFGKSQCRILLQSPMNHFQIATMPNPQSTMQMPKSDPLIAESIKLIIVSLVIDFHHSFQKRGGRDSPCRRMCQCRIVYQSRKSSSSSTVAKSSSALDLPPRGSPSRIF